MIIANIGYNYVQTCATFSKIAPSSSLFTVISGAWSLTFMIAIFTTVADLRVEPGFTAMIRNLKKIFSNYLVRSTNS